MGKPRLQTSPRKRGALRGAPSEARRPSEQQSKSWAVRSRTGFNFDRIRVRREGLPNITRVGRQHVVFEVILETGARCKAIVNPHRTRGKEWVLFEAKPVRLFISVDQVTCWNGTEDLH